MTASLLLALAAACFAAEGSPAHEAAEDKARAVPGSAGKGLAACHDDIERFCGAVKPGEGRLGACLEKNRKRLSKPCRRWLSHGGAAHRERAFKELDKSTAPAPSTAPPRQQAPPPQP